MTRYTSIQAYWKIRDEGLLSEQRWLVYAALWRSCSVLTGTQISALIPGSISNNVRTRLSELRDLGVVREVGVGPCPITGQEVILWDVNHGALPGSLKPKQSGETASARKVWEEVERIVGEAYGSWEGALEREEALERRRQGLAPDAPIETFGHARRVEGVLRHLRGALRMQRSIMFGGGCSQGTSASLQVEAAGEQSVSSREGPGGPAGAGTSNAAADGPNRPQSPETGPLDGVDGVDAGSSHAPGSSSSSTSSSTPGSPGSPETPISSPSGTSSSSSRQASLFPGEDLERPGEDPALEGRRPDGKRKG
jgi:hypothetical protein